MSTQKQERLTQARLKEVLDYDPTVGIFKWRGLANDRAPAGSHAGRRAPNGDIKIRFDGKDFFAHKLAWLFVYGYLPNHGPEHANRIKNDNRIKNLREVSQQCNKIKNLREVSKQYNSRSWGNIKNNTSGIRGVTFHNSRSKWQVAIQVMGKHIYLGLYEDFDEAVCARLAAEQGLLGCDSNSPAFQYVQKILGRDNNAMA